jgi:hypothetical protein
MADRPADQSCRRPVARAVPNDVRASGLKAPARVVLHHQAWIIQKGPRPMSRNLVYAIVAVLAVTSAVFGYQLYQERHQTGGVEIRLGDHGVTVETK